MGVLAKIVIFSIFLSSTQSAFAEEKRCYEKNIIYPNDMFGQFANRKHVSLLEIERVFKFKNKNMPQKPIDILLGFAYLEVFLNELCRQKQHHVAKMSREKMIDMILDTRPILGIRKDTSRQKVINFYWGSSVNNLDQSVPSPTATKIIAAALMLETKSQTMGFDNFAALIDTAVLQYGTNKRVNNQSFGD